MNILLLKKIDNYLLISIILLSVFGLVNLAGILSFNSLLFKKQLIITVIGFFLFFLFSLVDYRIFKNHPLPSLIFFLISVFLLFISIKSEPIRGVSAWISVPIFRFLGFNVEPSEIAKLAIILILAKFFSSRFPYTQKISFILISSIYVLIPVFLIINQPDIGSAIILITIYLGGILASGIKGKHISFILMVTTILVFMSAFFILKPYQKLRFLAVLNPYENPLGYGYNIIQSKIAIGSGGLWGFGFGKGFQSVSGVLPESYTDFAIAGLAEQFGLIGVVIIFVLYFIILSRLILIGLKSRDNFSRFYLILFIVFLFSHFVINMSMNIGILPIIGLPLGFISYGGSHFIVLMVGFGIVQSIRIRSSI